MLAGNHFESIWILQCYINPFHATCLFYALKISENNWYFFFWVWLAPYARSLTEKPLYYFPTFLKKIGKDLILSFPLGQGSTSVMQERWVFKKPRSFIVQFLFCTVELFLKLFSMTLVAPKNYFIFSGCYHNSTTILCRWLWYVVTNTPQKWSFP